jgi:hypothetical protein
MNKQAAETAERLKKEWAALMTDTEISFLRDMQGFIEFALRNGLTFPMVMASLLHDVNEIARDGFDYDQTRARASRLKVTGYSQITSDDFGESEEEEASR